MVESSSRDLMLISDWSLQEKQKQLLRHPLCLALLRRKWKLLGRYPQLSTILSISISTLY